MRACVRACVRVCVCVCELGFKVTERWGGGGGGEKERDGNGNDGNKKIMVIRKPLYAVHAESTAWPLKGYVGEREGGDWERWGERDRGEGQRAGERERGGEILGE